MNRQNFRRRDLLKSIAALCVILLIPQHLMAANTPPSTKPNIVLIMADDMGYECLGANGSTFYKTPNLDRLAADGMRFEHAYSQPICTPSRVQIMTGRYNFRNYVQFGVMHPEEITFGNVMKAAGYSTCIVGKWQLKGGFDAPTRFGFDEYCLWQLTRRPQRYANPGLEINGKAVNYPGKYGPDIASDFLIDFIKRHKDGPFFAYYPMILPHYPFQPTPDSKDWDPTKTKKWPKTKWTRGHFQDMVAYTDKIVGKIDKALRELGIRDNTLLIFTSDNGTDKSIISPFKGMEIRGGKGLTRNAGTHVPFVVSWPGTITPGQVSTDLIDFSDILPTLADLGGAEVPQDRVIDGRSFLPQLKGEKGNPRDWVFGWYSYTGDRDSWIRRYARNREYKLYHDGRFYNIQADELERNKLTPEQIDTKTKAVQDKLRAVIDKIYADETNLPYAKKSKSVARNPKKK